MGFRQIQELLVKNDSDVTQYIKIDLLPLFGGFAVINALRPILPGKVVNLVITFQPHYQQIFQENLRIYSDTSSLTVTLKGKGVNPEVKLDPEDQLLDAGPVLLGDFVEKTFTITNISNFENKFTLETLAKGIQNRSGDRAFTFMPQTGTIPALEKQVVTMRFQPTRVSE